MFTFVTPIFSYLFEVTPKMGFTLKATVHYGMPRQARGITGGYLLGCKEVFTSTTGRFLRPLLSHNPHVLFAPSFAELRGETIHFPTIGAWSKRNRPWFLLVRLSFLPCPLLVCLSVGDRQTRFLMSHERSQFEPPSVVAFPTSVEETGKAARNKFLLSGLQASSATPNASSSRAKSILEALRQKRESLSATLSASRSRHTMPAATGLDSTTKPAPRTPKGLVFVSATTMTTNATTAMNQPSPQPEVLSTPTRRFELSTQEIATIQSLKERIVKNRQAQQERWAAFKRDFDVDDSVAETAEISCSSSSSHSSSSSQGSAEVSHMTEEIPPEEAAEDSEQGLNQDKEETSFPIQPSTPTQATKTTSKQRQPLFSGLAKNLANAFARPNKNKKKQIVMRVKDLKTPNISCTLSANAVLNERSVVDTSMPEGMFVPISEGTALTSLPARRFRTLRAREIASRGSNNNKDRTTNSLKSLACSVAVQVGLTSLSMGLTMLQQRAWRSLRLRARRQKQNKKGGRITNSFDVASMFGGAIPRLVLGSVATTSTAEPVSARLKI